MQRMGGGAARCVYCRQEPVTPEWRPFCSERCKMADLGRWLRGDYRAPGPPVVHDEDGTPPSASSREDEALDES
jgi:endogenous inhibitor of DNA gyrase (YacG/DUF329 family)